MAFKLFKTYNEGQYGLKPWMANIIMGILEIALWVGWFFAIFATMFNPGSLSGKMIGLDILLIVLFLAWNILVWCVKPLRTKLNYKESIGNFFFIISIIGDIIWVLQATAEMSSEFGVSF